MLGILGASGFVGRSLIDHLDSTQIPHTAFCRTPKQSIAPFNHFDIHQDFDPLIFQDLTTLVLAISATGPTTLNNSLENEIDQNVDPHKQLLMRLLNTDIKHIIFLSSGGTIYGNTEITIPLTENTQPNPCTPYGYGKVQIEQAIREIWQGNGRKSTIIRASNPVGHHQQTSVGTRGLVTTTYHNILHDNPIKIYGDGSTVRDYFSVCDLSRLITLVANDTSNHSEIINAASGHGHSISEVVELCASHLGKVPIVEHDLTKQPTIQKNILSNTKAKSLYNWTPVDSFTQILDDLYRSLSV
jgi:UDP-glucose 4-epimerase